MKEVVVTDKKGNPKAGSPRCATTSGCRSREDIGEYYEREVKPHRTGQLDGQKEGQTRI